MQHVLQYVLAGVLWAVPLVAIGQTDTPSGEGHQQTITVKPAANGCAVVLSTKVGKALGTPEGLGNATLGETGRQPMSSVIACQCGAKIESKECPQGGSCTCGPGEAPAVGCN